jgi:hypothetical protein
MTSVERSEPWNEARGGSAAGAEGRVQEMPG